MYQVAWFDKAVVVKDPRGNGPYCSHCARPMNSHANRPTMCRELARLQAKVERLQAIVTKLQGQLRHFADRIDCRCHDDYTKRGRHEPNCTWDLAEEMREAAEAEGGK